MHMTADDIKLLRFIAKWGACRVEPDNPTGDSDFIPRKLTPEGRRVHFHRKGVAWGGVL